MAIKLFNSLTKTKEDFHPVTPDSKSVSMYHCGPTVYDKIHIGNLRSFFLADILRRMFEVSDYEVNQVMNITDIGHLTSDADSGEDKMTKGIIREGLPINMESLKKVGDIYTNYFLKDLDALNIRRPTILPRASEHIKEDIELIKKLEDKGVLYTTTDGVYFDTSKFESYGELAGVKEEIKKNQSQSRIGENSEKKNPQDFAVWKLNETMGYPSPWGNGFPGWHIECSAMSMKYLGESFDIHTGGADNAPIHHNNEIAQSECATGKTFAKYWLHGAFLNIKGGKMAKSDGGFITLESLQKFGINPLAYRYFLLNSHYRTQTDYSEEIIKQAEEGLNNLIDTISRLDNNCLENSLSELNDKSIHATNKDFISAIQDDLNTAKALSIVWTTIQSTEIGDEEKISFVSFADKILGLDLIDSALKVSRNRENIPLEIKNLAEDRETARANKDWKKSDEVRAEIESQGYTIKDGASGYIIEKK